MNSRFEVVRAARRQHAPSLLSRADVNAVSVGLRSVAGVETDEPCVTVWVDRKVPDTELSAAQLLPRDLAVAGTRATVDVRESLSLVAPAGTATGTAATGAAMQRERLRPVQGGASGASVRFPVGTLTGVVSDAAYPEQRYLLSCNHVLADVNAGLAGDAVLQPSYSDGGTVADAVASLVRWIPISFAVGQSNVVDAALAACPAGTCLPDVVGVGAIAGVRAAATLEPGEQVVKSGRSSGVSVESVLGTDADVWVTYWTATGLMRTLFREQILTTACAAYGDSGSPLLDMENRIVGMLFSGTAQTTAFNHCEFIETMLGVRFAVA